MKKMMTVLAACAIASFSLAAGDVTSMNIVGYQAQSTAGSNVGAGYNMLAVNWDKVGGGSIDIQDVFADKSIFTGGQSLGGDADIIKIWNPATSGYKNYYMYYNATPGYGANNGKWMSGANVATQAIVKGTAFWLQRVANGATNVTVSGQVATDASVSFTISGAKYNMIANPYATDLPLNGPNFLIDTNNAVGGQSLGGDADIIKIWDPATSGYVNYYLYYNATPGYGANNGKWMKGAVVTTDSIPMGKGAWYKTQAVSDWTLTITKPY